MSLIITLTGMSTSGKSTLAKALSSTKYFKEAVSVTTRGMRPGEVHGTDYYFVSDAKFDEFVEKGILLEHVRSHDAAYGMPAFEIEKILSSGKSPVMVLEPVGVKAMHRVAEREGYPILSAHVSTSMPVIIERFFARITKLAIEGKSISFEKEAKRLHTILSIESTWPEIWPWDRFLVDLHLNNNLDDHIRAFTMLHQDAASCLPKLFEIADRPGSECLSVEELARLIKDELRTGVEPESFYWKAIGEFKHKPKPNDSLVSLS